MFFELEAVGEKRVDVEEFFGDLRANSGVKHVVVIFIALTKESFTVSLTWINILVANVLRISKEGIAVCSWLHITHVLAMHELHREKGHFS